jgi:hypothetical protein
MLNDYSFLDFFSKETANTVPREIAKQSPKPIPIRGFLNAIPRDVPRKTPIGSPIR